jgi:hypothetical protein
MCEALQLYTCNMHTHVTIMCEALQLYTCNIHTHVKIMCEPSQLYTDIHMLKNVRTLQVSSYTILYMRHHKQHTWAIASHVVACEK